MKKLSVLCLLLVIITSLPVKSQDAGRFFPKQNLMTTGIYYYPEHWNPSQWERDIKRISSLGFDFIHIAEFAWAQMGMEIPKCQ